MKQLFIFILCLSVGANSFCQQADSIKTSASTNYLEKSKHQKTAAWVLLGSGVALGVGGAIWAGSNFDSSGPDVLFVAGAVAIVSSIPLFIAARRNKKKAMSTSANFQMQKIPTVQRGSFASKSYPALSIKMNF